MALLNLLRTRRFAEEELQRTKTDAIDAVGIARFAARQRPAVTQLPEPALLELRELMRLKQQIVQQLGDLVPQLHWAVDLGFPEHTVSKSDHTGFVHFLTGSLFRLRSALA